MDEERTVPRRRKPKPAQETESGYRLPLARRADFFGLLARVTDSGIPAKARGARARRDEAGLQ